MKKDNKVEITQEAMNALDNSIIKWNKIINGKDKDSGDENCACCQYAKNKCGECPICIVLGVSGCEFKEYNDWSKHIIKFHKSFLYKGVMCGQCIAYARDIRNKLIEVQDKCIVEKEDKIDTLNKILNSIRRQFGVDETHL